MRLNATCIFALTLLAASSGAAAADASLTDAVKQTDKATVRRLLQQRVDVNTPGADGTTPLHWAAHADDPEILGMLIRAGARVDAANHYGATPLWLASVNGNAASIRLLLEAGASASTSSPEGETVLMAASRSGRADAVKALLDGGAAVNAKESWKGQTALMWAAAEGHVPVIALLLERGADIHARSNGGFTALLFASREGQIGSVEALLRAGAKLTDSLPVRRRGGAAPTPAGESEAGLNALLLAAGSAHYELAAMLLDRGADANSAPQGWSALHQITWIRKAGVAGSNNPAPQGSGNLDSLEFVKRLAAHGADLNARVAKKPDMGITNINAMGATPFLLAARTADVELMRLLVSLGADTRLTNEDESTALMIAAGLGTSSPGEDPGTEPEVLEAVKLTLELGLDINAVDKNGETAMHGAAYKHVPSVVRFLAQNGAQMNVWNRENKKGWTPLRIAEGVHRGMNIVSSPITAAALRDVMAPAR